MSDLPNVIFLDMDGVLVNPSTCVAVGDTGGIFHYIDPHSAMLLLRLCEETNSKLVISSSWRKLYDKFSMQAILGAACPRLGRYIWSDKIHWRTKSIDDVQRGDEILQWVKENATRFNKFVVLDDDSDMDAVKESFVKCDQYRGFGLSEYMAAKEILASS